jgi:predicted transcriptional regulator
MSIDLRTYLTTVRQAALAKKVGLTQAAISKMVREKRNIFVVIEDDGSVHLKEEKILSKKSA